jgi:hypothetical protein
MSSLPVLKIVDWRHHFRSFRPLTLSVNQLQQHLALFGLQFKKGLNSSPLTKNICHIWYRWITIHFINLGALAT